MSYYGLQEHLFPNCCGIRILEGFGHTETVGRGNYNNWTNIKTGLKNYLKAATQGLVLIALNSDQKEKGAKILTEQGFQEVVSDFYHPGHGKTITLYAKAIFGTGMQPDIVPERTSTSVIKAKIY